MGKFVGLKVTAPMSTEVKVQMNAKAKDFKSNLRPTVLLNFGKKLLLNIGIGIAQKVEAKELTG